MKDDFQGRARGEQGSKVMGGMSFFVFGASFVFFCFCWFGHEGKRTEKGRKSLPQRRINDELRANKRRIPKDMCSYNTSFWIGLCPCVSLLILNDAPCSACALGCIFVRDCGVAICSVVEHRFQRTAISIATHFNRGAKTKSDISCIDR